MFIVKFNISLSHNSEYTHTLFDGMEIVELRSIFLRPTGAKRNTSNEQNVCSYYMLNHQIRGLLFDFKKNCYFGIAFYFFWKEY